MTRILILLAALAALAMPAGAQECVPTTSQPEVDVETILFGRQYVDNDDCIVVDPSKPPSIGFGHYFIPEVHGTVETECLFSVWTYTESNDIPGLQRGDEVKDDTCRGMIQSDTLTFF